MAGRQARGRVTGSEARCVWRLGAPTDQAFGGENRREKEDTVLCGPSAQWATVLKKIRKLTHRRRGQGSGGAGGRWVLRSSRWTFRSNRDGEEAQKEALCCAAIAVLPRLLGTCVTTGSKCGRDKATIVPESVTSSTLDGSEFGSPQLPLLLLGSSSHPVPCLVSHTFCPSCPSCPSCPGGCHCDILHKAENLMQSNLDKPSTAVLYLNTTIYRCISPRSPKLGT